MTQLSPEQVAANAILDRAVETSVQAYYPDDVVNQGIITEYVVVAAIQRWDTTGRCLTTIVNLQKDGDQPYHRILGLLEQSRQIMRDEYNFTNNEMFDDLDED